MKQRLVWNFEFSPPKNRFSLAQLPEKEAEPLKWEIRFFWPANEIVTLNTLDPALLEITCYAMKAREDTYYLLADNHCNIKNRRGELLYKPLLKQAGQVLGFGAKVTLGYMDASLPKPTVTDPFLYELAQRVMEKGVAVNVKKEALIFKFPTTPTIKLELTRLSLLNEVYLSVCVEGKSLELVERIAEQLLNGCEPCEYVSFLKDRLK